MSQYKVRVYEHKRNWVKYNENLVRRGELYLNLDFSSNTTIVRVKDAMAVLLHLALNLLAVM